MIRAWRLTVVALLCLAGAAISLHLTNIHINHIKTGIPSSCNFNESFNCDAVNTSRWSEIAGVPVAHLGMLTYLFMLGLSAAALGREQFRRRAHCYLFIASAWCVIFAAYMAFVSLVLIKAVCVWCATLYAVNILLFLFLVPGGFGAARSIGSSLKEDWGWVKGPAGLLLVLICAALVIGSSLYLRADLGKVRENYLKIPRILMNTAGAPSIGPEGARVTVVEISDFECPFCRQAARTLDEVLKDYPGKVRLVFKHYPLDNACNPNVTRPFHARACDAAKASVCAAAKGFFWPYAKKLLAGDIDRKSLVEYAVHLGLDPAEFEACLSSQATADLLKRDISACNELGLDGVPVFLINGRKIVGAQPPEVFKAVIEEELAATR
jgi:protein-disulfide isomerase/uncharacterized membrane protein